MNLNTIIKLEVNPQLLINTQYLISLTMFPLISLDTPPYWSLANYNTWTNPSVIINIKYITQTVGYLYK